jgi:hypothetical protein
MHVVEQGTHAIEADGAEELLIVKAVLAVLEDGVPFVGDLAEAVVDGHGGGWNAVDADRYDVALMDPCSLCSGLVVWVCHSGPDPGSRP